jgi:formate-nitrite transporter family protein
LELAFSGLAAGLSMGFSMVTEGILQHHLPNATWQPLITKLGYSVGFVVVILGRQQLFTKNTLTVILPLLREKKIEILLNVARLWLIVLIGNLIGAFVFAWLAANSNIFSPEIRDTFSNMGQMSMQPDFWTIVIRAAVSGWLIALMVWLLPFAEAARLWVIIVLPRLHRRTQFLAFAWLVRIACFHRQRDWRRCTGRSRRACRVLRGGRGI